jgi:hypothetical protein
MKTRARKGWKVSSGTICGPLFLCQGFVAYGQSRYSYQLIGKGRWNSLTLKKPKPKGAGRKEPKAKPAPKAKTGEDSSDEECVSGGDNLGKVRYADILLPIQQISFHYV